LNRFESILLFQLFLMGFNFHMLPNQNWC